MGNIKENENPFISTKNDIFNKRATGFRTKQLVITINERKMRFQIWDLSPEQRFSAVRQSYCRGALAGLVFFDITKRESFKQTQEIIKEIWTNNGKGVVPLVLIGLNGHLRKKFPNSTTIEQAERYANVLSERTAEYGFEIKYFDFDGETITPEQILSELGKEYLLYLETNQERDISREKVDKCLQRVEITEEYLEDLIGSTRWDNGLFEIAKTLVENEMFALSIVLSITYDGEDHYRRRWLRGKYWSIEELRVAISTTWNDEPIMEEVLVEELGYFQENEDYETDVGVYIRKEEEEINNKVKKYYAKMKRLLELDEERLEEIKKRNKEIENQSLILEEKKRELREKVRKIVE